MKLNCYASGDGSLSFVWVLGTTAQDDTVTKEHVLDYVRANPKYAEWLLIEGKHPKMVRDVKRLDENRIVMGNRVYRYETHNNKPSWSMFDFYSAEDDILVVNYSMRSALGYFLLNEESFENAIKISNVI